jgi:hypothetical protein
MTGPKSCLRRKKVAARFLVCFAILYPWIVRGYLTHDYQELAAAILMAAAAYVAFYILAHCDSD